MVVGSNSVAGTYLFLDLTMILSASISELEDLGT